MHEGRVILVTGASRGIGESVARCLASESATVLLVARSSIELERVAREIVADGGLAVPMTADIGEMGDIDRIVHQVRDEFGQLDGLVNCAGVLPSAHRIEKVSREDFDRVLRVNLLAAWYLAGSLKELFTTGAAIVNVASTAAFYPSIGLGPYCVSKAGLVMLTRVMALEWASAGIRVLAIAPGKVSTEMVEPILDFLGTKGLPVNPMQRVADPKEIADLVSFLLGSRASYMTGSIVSVDGGELVGIPSGIY